MSRIEAVFRKEIKDLLSHRALVYSFLALVLLFVLVPIAMVALLSLQPSQAPNQQEMTAAVRQLSLLVPALRQMPSRDQGTILILRHFTFIFLILPVIGALGSSTSSIVGEKQNRSIEPVLATPITSFELLLGKSLGTVTLSVGGTWLGFLLYATLVWSIVGYDILRLALDLTTLLMVLLLTPLIALLGLGAGVVISSRVKDSRSAQQVGGLLILPIVFLIVGQITGLFVLGPGSILAAGLLLLLLDLLVLRLGVRVFDREKIIADWK